jgi:lipid-A-disaccharide synthase-like uncharacterized protein
MRPELWYAIGFSGQVLFSARFIVQWIASEVKKKSVIPVAFWFLSLGGSLVLLTYAIYRRDPVFVVGQSAGLIVYTRNLILIKRERATHPTA